MKLVFPKYLSIQTTSLCNGHCIFCPYDEIKDSFPQKIMDKGLFKKIIDECSRYKEIERIILYMNNEPLTDPFIIERINYAKERVPWASVHILTNGSLLADELADKLINSKLDWIGISLHGVKKVTIKKSMGLDYNLTFKRVLNFIEKAKSKRNIKDFIMITFLRHKYLTLQEKDEAIKFWQDKCIERIRYFDGPISRAGNVKNLPKIYHTKKIVGCKSIWTDEMIHIVEDGKVVLCCMDWRREVILGDLTKKSIHYVWNGKRHEVWEMIFSKKDMPGEFLCCKCEEAKNLSDLPSIKYREIEPDTVNRQSEDLLLVMVPPWQTKMVPLGLAYLSNFLKFQGISMEVIDLNVKLFNNCADDKKYFWDIATINSFTSDQLTQKFVQEFNEELEDFITRVCSSKAKLIGFSTTIASTGIAIYLAHKIKLKDTSKIIILGGPGCYWNTFILDPERLVDIFVIGEGELPLLEIAKRFKDNNSLSNLLGIQGTIICINKQYQNFLPANPIKKLDDMPFPEFLEFNLQDYNKGSMYKPLPLLISRGCINRCSFCVDHKMNYLFRVRNPYKVVEEIKFHRKQYGVEDFEFNDLLCNGNLKQLERLCDLIIEENLDIKWTSYAAVREGMSLDLCKKMRKAGCRLICYGMESASDVVLRKMNKRYNSRMAEEVIRNTRNAGIETAVNIIIGHPGESEKEFKDTRNFIRRNKDYINQITNVSTCFLMLETDLMNDLGKYGVYFKRSFKDYLNAVLRKKEFRPNYREFYVAPDNTPYRRAQWLRGFLILLHKLNIPFVIVNYVKEHDRGLDSFIKKLLGSKEQPLTYKNFKIDTFQKGRCKLYFKNEELTTDVGMNSSFNIDKKWIDSSSAQWTIKRFNKFLDIKINWPDIPVTQSWQIRFERKYVDWKIKTYFNAEVKIHQCKIGVMISEKYNKYKMNETTCNFPDSFKNNWEEILFLPITKLELMAQDGFPSLVLSGSFKEDAFTQLQNAPSSLCARMVNFCLLDNDNPEGYNNEGRIFNQGYVLEGRIDLYFYESA